MKMDAEIEDHVPLFVDESCRKMNVDEIDSYPDPHINELIEKAQLLDDAPAFVDLINNKLSSPVLDEDSNSICGGLFLWNSGKCAAAIIDGQITKLPLATSLLSSMHYAAGTKAFNIVDLMLQRGFSANVRGDFYGHKLANMLPLHALLLESTWGNSEFSAVRVIDELCTRRKMLETLRMIALNTTEIKREFFNYLKEGKILPVVALLLVAKSSVLSPLTANGEGEFRSISEVHDFVLNTKNNKFVEMKETPVLLELLQILDKIGDKLGKLLRLDFTQTCLADCSTLLIASVIEDAGFDVKAIHSDSNLSDIRSEVDSKLLMRGIEECEKTICTTDIFPSWVKHAALRGLRDKCDSTTHLTYHFLAKTLPCMDSVSVSPLTPGTSSAIPENMMMMPPHHLLNMTAPFWGKIKKVFRRGSLLR